MPNHALQRTAASWSVGSERLSAVVELHRYAAYFIGWGVFLK